MNVVDSSAWLEYFAGGRNASVFASPIENTDKLLVPTICLYEVFKRICQQRSENEALQAVAVMLQGTEVQVDSAIALRAARLGMENRLPMADSLILATTRLHDAVLWTQDAHFEGMAGVRYAKSAE